MTSVDVLNYFRSNTFSFNERLKDVKFNMQERISMVNMVFDGFLFFHLGHSSRVPVRIVGGGVGGGPHPQPVVVIVPKTGPPVGQLRGAETENALGRHHHVDRQLLVLGAEDLDQPTGGTEDISSNESCAGGQHLRPHTCICLPPPRSCQICESRPSPPRGSQQRQRRRHWEGRRARQDTGRALRQPTGRTDTT